MIKLPELIKTSKSRSNLLIHFIFSVILTISIINLFITADSNSILTSGITASMEEVLNTLKGFGKMLNSIISMTGTVTTVVTLEALILFIAASLIGLGLSFLGIPRGKISFFCSVFIADVFWFLWIKSFNPDPSELTVKILIMIRTNIIIMIPFIIIYLFKSPVISKKLGPRIISFIRSVFRKKQSGIFNKKEIAEISDELNESFLILQKSFIKDALNRKDGEYIEISSETINYKKALEDVLKKLEK